MGRIRTQALVRAVWILLALCMRPALAQESTFKVDVRLVRMLVTVKDAAGRLIGALNKDDFSIFDNGAVQRVAVFERRTEQPLSIALLVDTSASTGIEMKYELDSVNRFLRALFQEGNSEDAVALYSFNWQVNLHSSFTRRIARLEQGLKQLKSEGGTSLYDAIYLASRDLEGREGRHVLVVVTDGGDTTSSKKFHEAMEAAQISDAVLYPLVVVPITNEAGRNVGGEHALTTLAAGTGGRIFMPTPGAELDRAFSDIIKELRTQYLLGFYPANVPLTKNRFHALTVSLGPPNLRVLTRNGYYGDIEDSTGRRLGR
ncbi:MAG: VWA domain-containing protein [Acidobacteriota bacterium]|nr:VWA domain-containing protein [Acidobacteriota bacterium]